MLVPPTVMRRQLDPESMKALSLMLEALVILDCAGESGPATLLSGAVDNLIDAPCAAEMTPAEDTDLDDRMAAYDTAIEKMRGGAQQAGIGPYGFAGLAAGRFS
jgi:hypothetical protein